MLISRRQTFSSRVATILSLAVPFCSSFSPTIRARGIWWASQYCSWSSSLGLTCKNANVQTRSLSIDTPRRPCRRIQFWRQQPRVGCTILASLRAFPSAPRPRTLLSAAFQLHFPKEWSFLINCLIRRMASCILHPHWLFSFFSYLLKSGCGMQKKSQKNNLHIPAFCVGLPWLQIVAQFRKTPRNRAPAQWGWTCWRARRSDHLQPGSPVGLLLRNLQEIVTCGIEGRKKKKNTSNDLVNGPRVVVETACKRGFQFHIFYSQQVAVLDEKLQNWSILKFRIKLQLPIHLWPSWISRYSSNQDSPSFSQSIPHSSSVHWSVESTRALPICLSAQNSVPYLADELQPENIFFPTTSGFFTAPQ